LWLLTAVCARLDRRRLHSRRPTTEWCRERLVDETPDVLVAEPGVGVFDLARRLSVSPHHLDRVSWMAADFPSLAIGSIFLSGPRWSASRAGTRSPASPTTWRFADQAHLAAPVTPPLSQGLVDRVLEVGQLTLMWPCIQGWMAQT
jgi:hypothetical protein